MKKQHISKVKHGCGKYMVKRGSFYECKSCGERIHELMIQCMVRDKQVKDKKQKRGNK